MSLTIGISTFVKRFDMFRQLVTDIRANTDAPIMVMVNGEQSGELDETYRRDLLTFCASHPNVYPHLFPTFQSLSKLWNTMVINAPTDHVWILNDDVHFTPERNPVPDIEAHIRKGHDLFYAPWGWSHFVIGRAILDALGYFDERLLGVGEEDGDMLWRYEVMFGKSIEGIEVPGVGNLYDFKQASEGVDTAYGNKTRFNTMFMFGRKYSQAEITGHRGIFGVPMVQVMDNAPQYPYERFKRDHMAMVWDTSLFKPDHELPDLGPMLPWVNEQGDGQETN